MRNYRLFLKYRKEDKCPYPWHIDPYGCGCAGGCLYCYAKPLLSFTDNWNDEPQHASMRKIRTAIKNHLKAGDMVRMGGLSDPLQPVEESYNITEMTVEALAKAGVHHLIVTKYGRVASDEMLSVYDKKLSHFQVTITSTDDAFAARYEGGSNVSDRIAAIEKLQDLGYDVSIRLSPLVPDFNGIRCDKVLVEFLRMGAQVRKSFAQFVDASRYSFLYNKTWHLPLEVKDEYIQRLLADKPTRRVYTFTDVVPEHFEYIRDHYNPNKGDCCNIRL